MKTLTEYLTNGSLDTKAIYGYKKKYYEKFFGDYYCLIEEDFENEPWRDFITEMLQSHDADKLIKMLQERVFVKYGNDIIAYKENTGEVTNVNIEFPNHIIGNYIGRDKDFQQLLFYFNYYITLREECIIKLEPLRTDKADYYVFAKYHGIVYHITKKKFLEDIFRRGLRPKEGNDYRYFPEKIFLFATEDFKDPKKRDEELKELAKSISHNTSEYVVLQIKFPKGSHREIYCDKSLAGGYAYYTFDDIPPQIITVYKDVDEL